MWLAVVGAAVAWAEPMVALQVGQTGVQVEVADTPDERAVGLMHRTTLAENSGMLFVYPSVEPRSFWMKNTLLPLTIAFIDADGRIVSLSDMKPLDLSSVESSEPAMYALEMNRGWFATHEVAVGDEVKGLPSPSRR